VRDVVLRDSLAAGAMAAAKEMFLFNHVSRGFAGYSRERRVLAVRAAVSAGATPPVLRRRGARQRADRRLICEDAGMHSIATLIIGGGIAGSSLACAMAERGAGRGVAIVDVDIFGKLNSSELNGGGVRCTFAEPVNVRLCLHSTRYYMQHARQFDYRQRGYLWMFDEALWQESRQFLPAVRAFGLPVQELSPRELRERFGVLDDVSDVAGATFTPFDGRLSPHQLRMHYLNYAQAGEVELMDRWEVVRMEGNASPYEVTLSRVPPRSVRRVLGGQPAASRGAGREQLTFRAERIINAAGPWASRVAKLYGRELPVQPYPRQVFLLRHQEVNLESEPFFIDYPQDIYFRYYERDRKPCTLVSWSDPVERARIDFTPHSATYYEQHVKPRLVRRIPALREAELFHGWVGHYELSPDKNAIVGPVPQRDGLFNYNGLSAHGVMQSRALGEALASLLIDGRWSDELNLDCLLEARFERGSVMEKMYV
jgi:sarcosine oxidase, subunit beta